MKGDEKGDGKNSWLSLCPIASENGGSLHCLHFCAGERLAVCFQPAQQLSL